MSEVLKPEIIQPQKTTLSDRVISWMCDHWQKIKPGNFRDRKNIVVNQNGEKSQLRVVEEKDLEVVHEVVTLYETSRETGKIVNKEKNPLGEQLNDLMIIFFGDTHLPGGNLEEEVYEKNEPYIFLKKVRAILLGLKKELQQQISVVEQEPREFLALKKALKNLKDRLLTSYQILTSGDEKKIVQWQVNIATEIENLRAEIREDDGVTVYNAFNALKNAFIRTIKTTTDSFDPKNSPKVLMAHLGDNISNEQKMGDVAFSAAQLEAERNEIEQRSGLATILTKTQGNHDTDLINYGLEHDAFDRLLFGSQVFYQEVGEDLVVLSLNTNFYSTFWHQHLERRKLALQHRIEQVASMVGDSEEKVRLQAINDRELVSLAAIRVEMLCQLNLVAEAQNSGKRIILIGHERGYLEQAFGGKLKDTNVVAVISGHDHKHSQTLKKNNYGKTVHYLNVGANKLVKTEDGNKSVLSGFSIRVRDTKKEGLEINEVVPTAVDYQSAVYSM